MKRKRADGTPREPRGDRRIKEGQAGYAWTEVARGTTEVKSHTSFLVFAIKHRAQ